MKAVKFLLFMALITFASCEKAELPEQALGTPVFSFDGLIEGESKSFKAGVDDYYLYTSAYVDSNDVLVYSGQLGLSANCLAACPESLTIELRSDPVLGGPAIDPQSVEYYNGLVDDETSMLYLQLEFINNSLVSEEAEYFWDFGNGETSDLRNPNPITYSPGISAAPFDISLTVSSVSGCTQTEVIIYDMDNLLTPACSLVLSDESLIGPAGTEICGLLDGLVPATTSWMSDVSFVEMNCLPVVGLSEGGYTVSAIDDLGCVDQEELTVVEVMDETVYCNANFQVESSLVPMQIFGIDKIGLGQVNIKYRGLNGVTYQSGAVADQSNNTFRILSTEDYELNENGKATRLIVYEFDALLASEQGDLIEIKNAQGTWALGLE